MNIKSVTRSPLRHLNYRALLYAAVFLLSAVISALGAGVIALLLFIPVVVAMELLLKRLETAEIVRYQERM